MTQIIDFMTSEHRHCDDSFAQAESAVSEGKWDEAGTSWGQFRSDLLAHLQREEQVLFPAFENKTGNTQGPTAVMRMEHEQMRSLVGDVDQALEKNDADQFLGLTETLMILMQQHNMKEEQILYPMSDQVLDHAEGIVIQMKNLGGH